LQKNNIPRAAESGASHINIAEIPDEIRQLVEAWPLIPENIKKAVQILFEPFLIHGGGGKVASLYWII
jgi:hypothetical protein